MDAARLQMRSDVTLGCCLSGGMDSTALVSVVAPKTPYRMRAFTARYADASMDEWRYVQSVANHTPIESVAITAAPEGFWEALPDVLWAQDEPFGGPAIYAQWLLMRTIREHNVRVILDGQGGDEILCGYAKYFYFSLWDMWRSRRLGALAAASCVRWVTAGAPVRLARGTALSTVE